MKNTSNTYHVFFTNLANPLKINIISKLKDNAKSVTELTKELNEEQSKVSHALSSLKNCSIVYSRQQGKKRFYALNKLTILPILKLLDKHENKFCQGKCKAIRK